MVRYARLKSTATATELSMCMNISICMKLNMESGPLLLAINNECVLYTKLSDVEHWYDFSLKGLCDQ